ncbi:MAG: TIGR03986 family type III CRISPR-associated RAMP protein [Candidatus Thorarchaeota archaeon]
MGGSVRFHNPYNFVRPIQRKALPTLDKDSVLMDRCPPPPHDRYVGYTGRIRCHIKVKTPLVIGMPRESGNSGDEQTIDFFRMCQTDGTRSPTIPSSSLRGIIRSVFEAATNSCFSVFDDSRLFRRMKPEESLDFIPARLEKDVDGRWIVTLFDGMEDTANGSPQAAAWIKAYRRKSPKPSDSRYQKRPIVKELEGFSHGDRCYALIEKNAYRKGKFSFYNVVKLAKSRTKISDEAEYVWKEGYVYKTGRDFPRKHDERFFFPANSRRKYEIPHGVISDYEKLLEVRGSKEKLGEGNLVWVKLNEGRVEHVIPVAVSKIAYKHSRGDLLKGLDLLHCTDQLRLCPACRVFGWVSSTSRETAFEESAASYKGRVTFSHAPIRDSTTMKKTNIILTMASPKPTATIFYLWNTKSEEFVDYDSENVSIRGRKFYLHHRNFKVPRGKKNPTASDTTIGEYADVGSVFGFEVHFENLAAAELGALIWSLELEDGMYHRLGMAKPYGFGSVAITIRKDGFMLCDMAKRYSTKEASSYEPVDYEEFVECFKAAMQKVYGDFESLANITDLRSLLSGPDDGVPIHYPTCKRTDSENNEGFEWFKYAKRGNRTLPLAHQLEPLDSSPCFDRRPNQSSHPKRGGHRRHKKKHRK